MTKRLSQVKTCPIGPGSPSSKSMFSACAEPCPRRQWSGGPRYGLTGLKLRAGWKTISGVVVVRKTPVTAAGLRKYDDLPAALAAVKAWTNPGNEPRWDRQRKAEARAGLPVLARALDRLATSRGPWVIADGHGRHRKT